MPELTLENPSELVITYNGRRWPAWKHVCEDKEYAVIDLRLFGPQDAIPMHLAFRPNDLAGIAPESWIESARHSEPAGFALLLLSGGQ